MLRVQPTNRSPFRLLSWRAGPGHPGPAPSPTRGAPPSVACLVIALPVRKVWMIQCCQREMVLVPALITQTWLLPTAAMPWGWLSPLPVRGLPAEVPSALNSETELALLLTTQTCLPIRVASSGALSPLPESELLAEVPSWLNSERVLVLRLGIQTWALTTAPPRGPLSPLPVSGLPAGVP